MTDIKTKENIRNPKIRDTASRMPKELARTALIEVKEKVKDHVSQGSSEDSPVGYARGQVMEKGGKAADTAGSAARSGAGKLKNQMKRKL